MLKVEHTEVTQRLGVPDMEDNLDHSMRQAELLEQLAMRAMQLVQKLFGTRLDSTLPDNLKTVKVFGFQNLVFSPSQE